MFRWTVFLKRCCILIASPFDIEKALLNQGHLAFLFDTWGPWVLSTAGKLDSTDSVFRRMIFLAYANFVLMSSFPLIITWYESCVTLFCPPHTQYLHQDDWFIALHADWYNVYLTQLYIRYSIHLRLLTRMWLLGVQLVNILTNLTLLATWLV